jgi:hypothetical protein
LADCKVLWFVFALQMMSTFEKESDGTLVWSIRQNVPSHSSVRFGVPENDLKKKFYFWSAEILIQDPEIIVSGLLIAYHLNITEVLSMKFMSNYNYNYCVGEFDNQACNFRLRNKLRSCLVPHLKFKIASFKMIMG